MYADGKLNGAVITYDEKGLKTSEIYYINNKMAGTKQTFFPGTTIPQKIEHYLDGKKNGIARNSSMRIT